MTTRTARACRSGGDATARQIVVILPGDIDARLSPNSRVSMRTQLRWRRKRKDDTRWWIRATRPEPIHGPVIVTYTRYQGPGRKPLDRDNLVACCKPILDAFVAEGIIDGDGPKIVTEIRVADQVAAGRHHGRDGEIMVTIEEAA